MLLLSHCLCERAKSGTSQIVILLYRPTFKRNNSVTVEREGKQLEAMKTREYFFNCSRYQFVSHADENKSVAIKRLMMLCARHKVFKSSHALGTNCQVIKTHSAALHPRVSDSVDLGCGLRILISNRFTNDDDTAGLVTAFPRLRLQRKKGTLSLRKIEELRCRKCGFFFLSWFCCFGNIEG